MKYHVNKKLLCIAVMCLTAVSLSAGELSVYTNEELGFSFSYPSDWHIEEIELGVIISSIPDFLDFEADGAGIALFIASIEDMGTEEIPKSNEDIWEALKKSDDTIEEKSLKNIEWLGKEWLVAEFYEGSDDCDCVFYFLVDQGTVYLVGSIYHPPQSEDSYKEIIEEIINSLSYNGLE